MIITMIPSDTNALWVGLEIALMKRFGKKPDMEAILFLIGLQETGVEGIKKITKEVKQDLMHVAVCTVLSESGYFVLEATDSDGWPHFRQLRALEATDARGQELLLKTHVIHYFRNKVGLVF